MSIFLTCIYYHNKQLQLKNFPLTGAELVEEGLLDLAGLLQLCVLPCGLLAHLTVQHGLSRNMYIL